MTSTAPRHPTSRAGRPAARPARASARRLGLTCLLLTLGAAAPAWAASSEDDRATATDEEANAKARPASLVELERRGLEAVEALPETAAPLVLLTGGTVMTATGDRFEPGWVVLRDGLVDSVGADEPPTLDGAQVIDVSGHFVTPGLIDTHSHMGVYPSPNARAHGDGNEATAPTTPGVWSEHSFWPQDPQIQRAVAGGVTTIQVLPGSANLIGGRGVVLQLVPGRGARAMRLPGAPETVKMACGENPKRVYGGRKSAPSTRMGNLRAHRTAFIEAAQSLDEWQRWEARHGAGAEEDTADGKKKKGKKGGKPGKGDDEDDSPAPPKRNLDTETLMGILTGDILVQTHCYKADDMLDILQMAQEFGFSIRSFHHALEAYKIRDILAEHDVAVSTWADWWGFKLEAYDGIPENLALVHEAGGRAVLHTDSGIGIQRMNQETAKAYYSGLQAGVELSEDDALRWVTANPAWALGIDHLTGTLEAGKRADVVVWDGHPFSVYTKARWVFVEGRLRYDKDRPQTWSDFELGQEVTP